MELLIVIIILYQAGGIFFLYFKAEINSNRDNF